MHHTVFMFCLFWWQCGYLYVYFQPGVTIEGRLRGTFFYLHIFYIFSFFFFFRISINPSSTTFVRTINPSLKPYVVRVIQKRLISCDKLFRRWAINFLLYRSNNFSPTHWTILQLAGTVRTESSAKNNERRHSGCEQFLSFH